jgi:hypothetical protein
MLAYVRTYSRFFAWTILWNKISIAFLCLQCGFGTRKQASPERAERLSMPCNSAIPFVLFKVMQKKHLHLFLLLLALAGCSPRKYSEVNPYFNSKNKFAIDIDKDTPAALQYGGVDVRAYGLSVPTFRAECYPFMDSFWQMQWGNEHGEPLSLEHRTTQRSLLSLALTDTTAGFAERAIPLEGGRGLALYLDSKVPGPFSMTVTTAFNDTLWSHNARRLSEKIVAFNGPDSSLLMVGAVKGISKVDCLSPAQKAPVWQFTLGNTQTPQVIMAFGRKPAELLAFIQKQLGHSASAMEATALADLGSHAGFSLHTTDEHTNETAALLSCALVGADSRVPKVTRLQIEESSQLATALFLASRQRPRIAFPPSQNYYTEQAKRNNLRWGSAAFRGALNWGMADEDTLRWLSLDILEGLQRLETEYITSDISVVADETTTDSLMRLAAAHVRLAGLMGLGEDISFARGDHEAQTMFRRESLWASKRAQELFTKCARQYLDQVHPPAQRFDTMLDTESSSDSASEITPDADAETPAPTSVPDTVLFLSLGARYGFNWLDARPVVMWNSRLAVGGFAWQKWLAYRFRGDLTITQTPDFDSLSTLMLDGPLPGFLTADPAYAGDPSLPVMAAAFQNLAEIYLGLRPDAFEHKVWIEPRLPSSWGHTAACVPFSTGYLHLDYDFGHDHAIIGMSGINREIQIYFGYPLESGGFLRTQFTLVPGEHPQRIDLKHEKENRLKLDVNNAP